MNPHLSPCPGCRTRHGRRAANERYFLNNFIGLVSDGQLRRAWDSQRDVTLSRQAERVIQASEARFRSVLESGMMGIAFWNDEFMTEANDILLSMLGYTREDLRDGLLRHGRLTAPAAPSWWSRTTPWSAV